MENLIDARALVAIGMNGDMVILSVGPENFDLAIDAGSFPASVALLVNSIPQTPGIYEFRGYTAFEALEDMPPVAVHKGSLEMVVEY